MATLPLSFSPRCVFIIPNKGFLSLERCPKGRERKKNGKEIEPHTQKKVWATTATEKKLLIERVSALNFFLSTITRNFSLQIPRFSFLLVKVGTLLVNPLYVTEWGVGSRTSGEKMCAQHCGGAVLSYFEEEGEGRRKKQTQECGQPQPAANPTKHPSTAVHTKEKNCFFSCRERGGGGHPPRNGGRKEEGMGSPTCGSLGAAAWF